MSRIRSDVPMSSSFVGAGIQSASYAISASYALNGGGAGSSDWNDLTNVPIGLVSSSAQVNSGSFTGSFTGSLLGTSSYATFAVSASYITGSIQFNDGLIVTGSVTASAYTGSFTGSATFAVSSSYALSASYADNGGGGAGSADWNDLTNIPAGLVSASAQINTGSFTGSFTGSATDAVSSSFATNALTANAATVADSANAVTFANVSGKPTLVSSSIQIDHDATTNFDAAEHFTQANITTVGTVTAGNINAILPTGTVSSSLQLPAGIQSSSYGITIESPTAAEDISWIFTDKAITIRKMVAVCVGTTPSVTWTVRHGTDRSAAGAEVVTGGTTTTSTTTGATIITFNDATIVADSHIWLETTAQSGTVTSLQVTLYYTVD